MSGVWTHSNETDEPSLVRPYTLTAGRTDAGVELPLEAAGGRGDTGTAARTGRATMSAARS